MLNTILHDNTLIGYITEILGGDINRINISIHKNRIHFYPISTDLQKELYNVGKPVISSIDISHDLYNTNYISCIIRLYINTGNSKYIMYLDDEVYPILTTAYNTYTDSKVDLPLKMALIFMSKSIHTTSALDKLYLKMFNHTLPIYSNSLSLSKENKLTYAKDYILKFIDSGDLDSYIELERGFVNNVNNMYISYVGDCDVNYAPLSKYLRLFGLIKSRRLSLNNNPTKYEHTIDKMRSFIDSNDKSWLSNLPNIDYNPVNIHDWFRNNIASIMDKYIPVEWLGNVYMSKCLLPIIFTNYNYQDNDDYICTNANVYGNPNRGTYFSRYIFKGTDVPELTNIVRVLLPSKVAVPFYVTCYKLIHSTEANELIIHLTIKRGINPSTINYLLSNTSLLRDNKDGILKLDPYIDVNNNNKYEYMSSINDSISIKFAIKNTSRLGNHIKIKEDSLNNIFNYPKYNTIDYNVIYSDLSSDNVLYFDHSNIAVTILDYDNKSSDVYKRMEAAYKRHEPINLYDYIIAGLKWIYNRHLFLNYSMDIYQGG